MSEVLLSEDFETRKKESVKPDYLVYKTNPLLMVRDEMAIMQARFFTAYLCKVDPENPATYTARFSLAAFCKMLDVDTSNIKKLKEDCKNIRSMGFDFIEYRRKHGEKLHPLLMDEVSLFERFTIVGNSDEGYFIEVTPTRPMEHLLLNLKKYGFVSYEAKNTLVLSTKRYMRMYEFLKRHEGKGITIDIRTLKAYLGLSDDDYSEMRDFRRKVLDKGIKEINEKTDILVACEPKKKGRGGKIVGFHFSVRRNKTALIENEKVIEEDNPFILSNEDIEDFNEISSASSTESEAPDLTSRKKFIEADEYVNDFSINPLNLSFEEEADRQNYIDRYVELNIQDELCRDFLLSEVPEEIHKYNETNLEAIATVAKKYIKYSQAFEMHHLDRKLNWHTNISNAVGAYTKQRWLPKHQFNVTQDAFAYYLSCFEYWLRENVQ